MVTHDCDLLGDLPIGASAVVEQVDCDRPLARRLMEMGLLPGTRVTVARLAPLGDPVELRLRGYSLSIRRADASRIAVVDVRQPFDNVAAQPELIAG